MAFLFPWAVALGDIGLFGFWSMMLFLGVLTVGSSRMAQRSVGMGVITPAKPDPITEAALTRALNDELADKGFVVAQLDKLITWARTGSMWGLTFGLACCGVEMIHCWMSRYDLDRFGFAPMPSPAPGRSNDRGRHAHLQNGRAHQAALRPDGRAQVRALDGLVRELRRSLQASYSVCKGVDQILPVDVYVPGCPPRPRPCCTACCSCRRRSAGRERWCVDG